jgi:hypothetical protein
MRRVRDRMVGWGRDDGRDGSVVITRKNRVESVE